jgi:S-formylglutathione hydrolase FrmB
MKVTRWLGVVVVSLWTTSAAWSFGLPRGELDRANQRLHGRIIDHTHNHGCDRRIWSDALHQRRDLYVYLPPGFDPRLSYPLMIYLHGISQDEQYGMRHVIEKFDRAIACGQLPPMIIASPDGSIRGRPGYLNNASFYLDSRAGNFEQYLLVDVWNFVVQNYPIRPEREAHAIVGVSMGGTAAYRIGIEHQDRFKVIVGFFPGLNLRWVDCHGRYRSKFDPECAGWRESYRPNELIARFGLIPIRFKLLSDPLFHRDEVIESLSRSNPYELMEKYDLRDGQLSLYVCYGGRDQFHIDAQVESFVHRAQQRGIQMTVGYDPRGKHDYKTAMKFFDECVAWLAPQLAPYGPPLVLTGPPPKGGPRPVHDWLRRLTGR